MRTFQYPAVLEFNGADRKSIDVEHQIRSSLMSTAKGTWLSVTSLLAFLRVIVDALVDRVFSKTPMLPDLGAWNSTCLRDFVQGGL